MEIKTHEVSRIGTYHAYCAEAWDGKDLLFDLIIKLTSTELAVSINRECVSSEREAIQQLKKHTEQKAQEMLDKKKFTGGKHYSAFFSPCNFVSGRSL